ncbi:MAG: DMT family transporter [Hyphomicrobiaceae bacterium]|nr:DMT family transporter [Hyphomicrobiaceae bacterium]
MAERPHQPASYLSGVLLVLLGTIAFSSAGLFVRVLGKDAATTLFWRGLFTALVIVLYVAWREGPRTIDALRAMGGAGIAIAALSALSMGCFITSLQFTTVANNSIIFGTSPFVTAALAWIMIREPPATSTLAFSAIALGGAGVVVASSLQLSVTGLVGDALAVLMTLAFAAKTVLVRKHAAVSMVPSGALGALMGSAGAAPFVTEWALSAGDVALFALFGFTQQGAGLILTTIGIARLPSAHAALLMALDVPLSPTWVWLVVGERPAAMALAGGAMVLAAVVGHIVVESRRRSR